MPKKIAAALLTVYLIATPVIGQQQQSGNPPPPENDDVVRITTNLVQVDAVVTDKKGNLIKDLKPEDFQVFEDGKAQKITNFSFISLAPDHPIGTAAPMAVLKNAPDVPPALITPEHIRRTIALVVDDLGLSFESIAQVRKALKKYVDEEIQPGDLVAIIRTSGGVGALQQFTTDKRILYAAIEHIRWYPNGRAGISAFEPISPDSPGATDSGTTGDAGDVGNNGDDLEEFRQNVFAVGTLGALQYVIRGLEKLPGRKAAVLFSDGLAITNQSNNGATDRTLDAMRQIVEQANRSSVVVYTMDSKGLVYTGITAADNVSGMTPQRINDPQSGPLAARRDSLFRGQEGLNFLARETGGIPIRNTNDLAGGLRRVMEDQTGYYLIGYRPDASTFDQKGAHKMHSLSIKVTRPGLEVRSRKGFLGVTDLPTHSVGTTRNEQLAYALTSPFGETGVNVRLTSLYGNDPTIGTFVRSLLHVRGSDLTFTDEPDGWKKMVFDLVAVTYGDNGQVVDQVGKTETVRVSQRVFELVRDNGFDYVLTIPIKKPGAYQFRMAFRDTASQHLGSASQFVNIPDVKKNRLNLSGIVVNGYDVSAATTSAVQPAANATATGPSNEQIQNPMAGPAVRQFKQGMVMKFVYFIYNAHTDKQTGHTSLLTQVRLFKEGKAIYNGESRPLQVPAQPDYTRITTGNELRIPPAMAPGSYVLQVIVTDQLAGDKFRTASQWIDFEVVH